jgi:hypothetical protein
MNRLLRHAREGHTICGAGVVVGSLVDPRTIGNDHIRIHALEGQLFRTIVQTSLSKRGVKCSVWRERDLFGTAGERLGRKEPVLRAAAQSGSGRSRVVAGGAEGGGPCRVDRAGRAIERPLGTR